MVQTRPHSELGCYTHLLPAPCCNELKSKTKTSHSRTSSCLSPFLPKQRAKTQPGGSDISVQIQPLQRATATNSLSNLQTRKEASSPPSQQTRTKLDPLQKGEAGRPGATWKHQVLTCLLCRRTAASAGWLNRNFCAFPRVITAPVAQRPTRIQRTARVLSTCNMQATVLGHKVLPPQVDNSAESIRYVFIGYRTTYILN